MSGRPWTRAERAILRRDYPNTENRWLAWRLKRKVGTIHQQAAKLGIKKTPAFLSAMFAQRAKKRTGSACGHRFTPGHRPWNYNMKGLQLSPSTQFKKGSRPHTWRPIGSERLSKEGYRERKMTDTGYSPRDWRALHVLAWEAAHGPVPKGHVVAFKDRKGEPVIANLECISRGELARRNTYWANYPPALAKLIQLQGALNRQINRRDRHAERN